MRRGVSLYWSHQSCKSVSFSNTSKFIFFFPDSPHSYAQHNTNKQPNIFPLVTETFQTLLSNNTHSEANKTKLQATSGQDTVLPHSLHLRQQKALNQQQERAQEGLDVKCRSRGVLGFRQAMWKLAHSKAT